MLGTVLKDDIHGAPTAAQVLAALRSLLDPENAEPDPFGGALRVVTTLIPRTAGATLSRRRGGHTQPRTVAVTAPEFALIDRAQFRSRQGPIADALTYQTTVTTDDVTHDTRWPELERRLAGTAPSAGVSMIIRDEFSRGIALTLYSRAPLTTTDLVRLPLLVAMLEVVLVALAQLERVSNLRRATVSNRRIGIAVGVLMAYRRNTDAQAFAALAAASQSLNRKVADLAEEVILTGILPERPGDMPTLPGPRRETP